MSTDPMAGSPGAPGPGGGGTEPAGAAGQAGQPSEAELRAAYEAELSRISSADLMLQAAVSLLNVGSYRLAPRTPGAAAAGEQAPGGGPGAAGEPAAPSSSDLEQARDAIDGARALIEILERSVPSEIAPLRNALSQLQMAYARAVQAAGAPAGSQGQGGGAPSSGGSEPSSGGAGGAGGGTGGAPASNEPGGEQRPPGPGPAESSGRLWVPGR